MSQDFLNVLKCFSPAETPERLEWAARELQASAFRVAAVLNSLRGKCSREDILAAFNAKTDAYLVDTIAKPDAERISPEVFDWVLREMGKQSEEELVAELREVQRTGGVQLKDLLDEYEQGVAPRE